LASGTVDSDGSFSVSFKAPAAKAGSHVITVSDENNSVDFTFVMESDLPPIPVLLSPIKSESAAAAAAFQWAPVIDPSGATYTLQVSLDPNFSSLLLEKKGLPSSNYQLTEEEKLKSSGRDMPYYWRVKAVDAASK
jgi:hypothetical protein